MIKPELFRGRACNIEIETRSPLTLGMRVIDRRGVTERPRNALVLGEVDAQGRFDPITELVVLAPRGPQGLDTSPRGDAPGFVQVADAKTRLLPDRRGNDRINSPRNILHDPQVALQVLIPGLPEVLRVNGLARISASPALLERFVVDGKRPATGLVITVNLVFFPCARAIKRSRPWDPAVQRDRSELPSPGEILQALEASFDGVPTSRVWNARTSAASQRWLSPGPVRKPGPRARRRWWTSWTK